MITYDRHLKNRSAMPHRFEIKESSKLILDDIVAWCQEQFGEPFPGPFSGRPASPDELWCGMWGNEVIFIRHDRDAFNFRLRWC
jgi:hypothetical protein